MDAVRRSGISDGDVVVVGNRADAQRLAIERGARCSCSRTARRPTEEVLELRASAGTAVIVSPLDTYVSGRMITLAAPCGALMERDPLTVHHRRRWSTTISEQIKESHYGAAVVVDAQRRPVGLVTRSDLVVPAAPPGDARRSRRAGAERARDRPGRDRRDPRPPPHRLDRDPDPGDGHVRPGRVDGHAGGRALPAERDGAEPTHRDDAARRGPVRHGDPQLGDHDRARSRASSSTSSACSRSTRPSSAARCSRRPPTSRSVSAEEIISRDAKRYQSSSGHTICIAQVEVVGKGLLDRKEELLDAMRERAREPRARSSTR